LLLHPKDITRWNLIWTRYCILISSVWIYANECIVVCA
jgi:hypothetical protein